MSLKRRVVVTGIGAITPCGANLEKTWQSLIQGKSGIDWITLFDASDHACKIAGEVKNFKPEEHMDKKEARRMDRFMQFALVASREAYEDAGLKPDAVDPDRFSVVIGTGSGGIGAIESQHREVLEKGPRRCSPFFIPMMICDMAAGRVSIAFNARGPNMAIVTACATGADAIGNAFRMIQYDETDIAIAGGSEAAITPMSIAGFAAARAMTHNNSNPQTASRPFDCARDGFIMGEGSCTFILEDLEHAKRRGANIYGELVGYGRSSDAYDIVSPPPEGYGAVTSIRAALRDAGLRPDEVDYVNAHATSTPIGDIAEIKALKTVFGDHTQSGKLLVSATKSMTGHMIGAAGSMEAAIALLALQEQIIPPTINLEHQDPACDLDVVPNQARPVSGFKVALSNSFGFGGHNAALIFRVFQPS